MLTVAEIAVAFGGFQALRGVGLTVAPGSIVGLVGPNGSGKSTLINVISGIQRPDRGAVSLGRRPMPVGLRDLAAGQGIGRTFQVPRLARRLTVMQNMLVGARGQIGEGMFALFLRPGKVAGRERQIAAAARAILERLGL